MLLLNRVSCAWVLASLPLPFFLCCNVSAQDLKTLGPKPVDQRTPQARTTGGDEPSPFLDAVTFAERGQRLIRGKIVGGQPAPTAAYPWIVSIGVAGQPFSIGHFCGGTLISKKWVVTAAHCFKGVSQANQIQVKYGTNVLSVGGYVASVESFALHPAWNPTTFENDVAVIALATPADAATPITLIDVAGAGPLFGDGILAVVAGWGLTQENGAISDTLRHVGVQVVSNATCNAPSAYGGQIKDVMFCAGFVEGGKDSCQGDSGGPLMAFDGKGGYILAGVVSWGDGCARENKYGVYTRLTKVVDWVREKTK